MRFRLLDRVVSALSGLVMVAFGVGLFVFGVGVLPFRLDLSFLDQAFALWQRAIMVAAAVALCLVGLRSLSLMFRSSKEKGFILQHTDYGDLSISMTAMENMVKKCVDTHSELKVSSTRIHHARDGVIINLRIALANGVNIPIAVNALQKQIKQYITSCSGVDVREVRVMVETNNSLSPYTGEQPTSMLLADVDAAAKAGAVAESLHEATQTAMPPEVATKETPEKEPFHVRLFRREEKQQMIPQPPAEAPQMPDQAPTVTLETSSDEATEAGAPSSQEIVDPSEALSDHEADGEMNSAANDNDVQSKEEQ